MAICNNQPTDLMTFDHTTCKLDDTATHFVREQRDIEIMEQKILCLIWDGTTPGMYSPPIGAVPKPHPENLHLINDHSAEPHSLNVWIDKLDLHFCLNNLHDLGTILHSITMCQGCPPYWLFTSDVLAAYCWWLMHPLWQIKQIVTVDGERYVN